MSLALTFPALGGSGFLTSDILFRLRCVQRWHNCRFGVLSSLSSPSPRPPSLSCPCLLVPSFPVIRCPFFLAVETTPRKTHRTFCHKIKNQFKIVTITALIGAASAACPNQCSGHGSCGNQDVCECYDNWGMGGAVGGDCSDRLCPSELAWVDAANVDGSVHNYAECSAKGVCDRSTGECDCLDGYEGKACARQTCKDNCNGHGTCAYMSQIPFGTVWGDWAVDNGNVIGIGAVRLTTTTDAWDTERARACFCDAEWAGISCDRKVCPHGSDAMFVTEYKEAEDYISQVQTILLVGNAAWVADESSFALTFTSRTNQTFTTSAIAVPGFTEDCTSTCAGLIDAPLTACELLKIEPCLGFHTVINDALEGLPNRVIDSVDVSVVYDHATFTVTASIAFDGSNVQGRQNLLELDVDPCGAGCTPQVNGIVGNLVQASSKIEETVVADFNSYECGRRGKCDYDTGICACFEGFTGPACSTITALI